MLYIEYFIWIYEFLIPKVVMDAQKTSVPGDTVSIPGAKDKVSHTYIDILTLIF